VARWLVELVGEQFDLEEFPRGFPNGEVFAVEIDGAFYLTGSAFESLTDCAVVQREAANRLTVMAGALMITMPNLHAPSVGNVTREQDDASRSTFAIGTGIFEVRSKFHGVGAVLGGVEGTTSRMTVPQSVLERAHADQHLEEVLSLWSSERTWPRLYRILEEVEEHLGEDVDDAGFCSHAERERFTRTANTAEVAGPDARHAGGQFEPPRNPMTRDEAEEFVGRILQRVVTR
jgi:hypothetical protein